ncbi:MAG: hypothetical protein H8E30_06775, partial [Alphaproteobacteria bacterium]|nr:hypothetical protein [Alphaproteobacteria bacterium]
DGGLNWDFGTGEAEGDDESQWSLPRIEDFRLLNTRFIYRDGGEDIVLTVSALNIHVPNALAAAEIDLKAKLRGGPVTFTGRVNNLDALLKDQEIQVDGALAAMGSTATVKGRLFHPLQGHGVDIHLAVRTAQVQELLRAAGVDPIVQGKADVAFDLSDRDGPLAARKVTANIAPGPGIRIAVTGQVGDALALTELALDLVVQADDAAHLSTLIGADLPSLSPFEARGHLAGAVARPVLRDLVVQAGEEDRLLLTATGSVSDPLRARGLDLAVHLRGPDITVLSSYADVAVPALGRFEIMAALTGSLEMPAIDDLRLRTQSTHGAELTLTGRAAKPLTGEDLDLRFNVTGPAGAVLGDILGWPLSLGDALTAKGRITGSAAVFQLDDLDLRLKDSDVAGKLGVDLRGDRPKITADLNSKYLDLDLFPDNRDETSEAPGAGAAQRLIPDMVIDLSALALLDGTLKLQAAGLRRAGLVLEKLHLTAALHGGTLTVRPSTAQLAKGQLTLGGILQPDGLTLQLDLRQASMATLGAMLDFTALDGSLDLSADLRAYGRGLRDLAGGLDGKAAFVVSDGHLESRFLDLLATDLLLGLFKDSAPEAGTRLHCFANSYVIKDGVAVSQALLLDTDNITVVGEGQTDLTSEAIRYHLVPRPKDPSLVSLATPINIGGTLASPSYAPDSAAVAGSVAAAVVGNILLPGIGLLLPLLNQGTGEAHPCLDVVKDGQAVAAPAKAAKEESETGILDRAGGAVSDGAKQLLQLPGKILGSE